MNVIHTESDQETELIDGPISFTPINPNRVIVPHYNALVLTLCINGFAVHTVLVDPGRATDLLQVLAFTQMKILIRATVGVPESTIFINLSSSYCCSIATTV